MLKIHNDCKYRDELALSDKTRAHMECLTQSLEKEISENLIKLKQKTQKLRSLEEIFYCQLRLEKLTSLVEYFQILEENQEPSPKKAKIIFRMLF